MKKNLISLAVAASVLGTSAVIAADAQHVSPNGTGQVLLFPFYNADSGNATNMHIVNTTGSVKAVKIRFVEHKNSTEVLDFNVYLSGNDHFAFGVIPDPNGNGAAIITNDNSCTVPALGSANGAFSGTTTANADGSTTRIQPFVNYQYANLQDVDTSIQRTLTGHVEVIEMGVVGNTSDTKKGAYAAYATHGATGVPLSCALLNSAWASGTWATTGSDGITAPTGGLYGLAYHINVASAAAYGFEPTAIEDFRSAALHTNPGTLSPSISSGLAEGAVYHGAGDDQHVAIATASGIQTTSAILMADSISNDVMTNPAIGGMTDWVVSFPTKRQHVDKTLVASVVAPFTDNFDGNATKGTAKVEKPACEPVGIQQWDREEGFSASTTYFSPTPLVAGSSICNEVAVVAMGAAGTASAMGVTQGLTNLGFAYSEGWQRFTFGQTNTNTAGKTQQMTLSTPSNATIDGLPVIGFAAYKVNNGAMSYGNASEYKTSTVSSGLGST